MKSLKPRLLTAVIGIPILLIVLFISELWHPFVGIVIGAFSAFMTGEYLHARKMLYKFHLSIPCMLFNFSAFGFSYNKVSVCFDFCFYTDSLCRNDF